MSKHTWTDEKLFSRLLTHKSNRTYWDTIGALRTRPTPAVFGQCVAFTKSDQPKERIIGIDILAQLGIPPRPVLKETMVILFELLENEKDPKVLMSLLYAIGHNNDQLTISQVERLCYFSETKDRFIREGFVFSLLGVDHANAIEALIKLSNDKSSHIRNWATFGLGTQVERDENSIREALWSRINDKHQQTKLEAIHGLAKRRDSRVKDIIIRELQAGEYGIVLLEAILEIGDQELLFLLRKQYTHAKEKQDVPSAWLEDLNNCIKELGEKING